jgi:hypothetical protein
MNNMISAMALNSGTASVDLLVPGSRHIEKVEGLAGLVTREVVAPKPGRHGVLNRSRKRDVSPVVITGQVFGDDPDGTWDEYDALVLSLAGAVDIDSSLDWTRGSSLDLVLSCRLVGLSDPVVLAEDVLQYQLTLRPNDPRSFAAQQTHTSAARNAGGAASFTMAGTDSTPPVLELHGPLTNPKVTLSATGEFIKLNTTLSAGQGRTISVADRQVTNAIGGGTVVNDQFDYANSSFFEVPPGAQTLTVTSDTGSETGFVDVLVQPAYA